MTKVFENKRAVGCKIERVVILPDLKKVELYVAKNEAPDMGGAIELAQRVWPAVKTIVVLEGLNGDFVLRHTLQGGPVGGKWSASTSIRRAPDGGII
jgi:hypothetical protein